MPTKIVQAEHNAKKKQFFLGIVEAQPIFAAGKVVQAERRTKLKTKFFVFYPEAPPIFASGKVVQAEDNAKKKQFFLGIVEAQPIFAAGIIWRQYHFRGFNQPCTAERNP